MITKREILSLIALAIMTVVVLVACGESPTDVGNMSVTEAGPTPTPEFPSDNTKSKLEIDENQGLAQFKDLSFKSGAYYSIYDMTKKIYFYAYIKVDNDSKPYIKAITKDENGAVVESEGKFYDNANGKGAVYNLEAVRYESKNRNTATVTFTEDGYLRIKFSNYGADITYSLTDKKAEEEISTDGATIPEVWHGTYEWVEGSGSPHQGSRILTIELTKTSHATANLAPDSYLGDNTWSYHCNAGCGQYTTVTFGRNDKGQRIVSEVVGGALPYILYIHSEDKNK